MKNHSAGPQTVPRTATNDQRTRKRFNPFVQKILEPVLSTDPIEFHRRLPGYAPTPLINAPKLAAKLGVARVWVKDEEHRLGLPAYKILGAGWATYRALEAHCGVLEPWNDLVALRAKLEPFKPLALACATDGNHGRAVARMARLLGLEAQVLVPRNMVAARIEAIEGEGAQVTVVDGSYDDAVNMSATLASDRCLVISDTAWEGYDHVPRWVIEGYQTIHREIDQELERLGERQPDVVAVQIGVGALASSVVNHYHPLGTRIVGVEPTGAACVLASIEAGEIIALEGELETIMAGLNCGTPSPIAWPLMRAGIHAFTAIPDETAEEAMRLLADSGIVSGESGAAGLGGLLQLLTGDEAENNRRRLGVTAASSLLVLSTEGATDPEAYEKIVGSNRGPNTT
jgi:diaminopropionate ammonia-lyase